MFIQFNEGRLKMKTKNTIFAVLTLFVIGIVVATSASAFGFGWMQEDKEDIRQAINNKDFDAWKDAIQSRLTEENFNEFVARHKSISECRESRDLIRDAIDNEDYEAYLDVISEIEDCPHEMPELTEDEFNILLQIHDARQEGDMETIHELMDQLDVDMLFGNGQGFMMKGMNQMHRGMNNLRKGMKMQNTQRNIN